MQRARSNIVAALHNNKEAVASRFVRYDNAAARKAMQTKTMTVMVLNRTILRTIAFRRSRANKLPVCSRPRSRQKQPSGIAPKVGR